ncbi:MAG TPA: MBL fold metallo-hydrolase [Spirochaetota bacterium]
MIIDLWGVRGSIPAPMGNVEYRLKLREILQRGIVAGMSSVEDIEPFLAQLPANLQYNYGGNTTCATVKSSSGQTYILDCGTGVRTLGDILMKGAAGKGKAEIHIFITHTHWDHIQGIPFFKPLYIPGNIIHFHSGISDLADRLSYQQTERFFPKPFEAMEATKEFHLINEGEIFSPEKSISISCQKIKHPGGSMAYRFDEAGKTFIFATDAEFTADYLETFTPAQHSFFNNADLLVIDSQYTLDEAFKKFDWGHTSYTMAINCAIKWKSKRLVLTHHEPAYFDEKLHTIHEHALEHRNAMDESVPEIFMGREGFSIEL